MIMELLSIDINMLTYSDQFCDDQIFLKFSLYLPSSTLECLKFQFEDKTSISPSNTKNSRSGQKAETWKHSKGKCVLCVLSLVKVVYAGLRQVACVVCSQNEHMACT